MVVVLVGSEVEVDMLLLLLLLLYSLEEKGCFRKGRLLLFVNLLVAATKGGANTGETTSSGLVCFRRYGNESDLDDKEEDEENAAML